MIYIIEGLDRMGKSTFIDALRNEIQNPYVMTIHSSKPPKCEDVKKWTERHYLGLISKILHLDKYGYDVILDRSWLGEMVYGPLYRGTNISLSYFEHVIADFSHRFKMVLFIDSAENAISREDGKSHSSDIDFKKKEIDLFVKAFNSSIIQSKMIVDWSNEPFSLDSLKSKAKDFI